MVRPHPSILKDVIRPSAAGKSHHRNQHDKCSGIPRRALLAVVLEQVCRHFTRRFSVCVRRRVPQIYVQLDGVTYCVREARNGGGSAEAIGSVCLERLKLSGGAFKGRSERGHLGSRRGSSSRCDQVPQVVWTTSHRFGPGRGPADGEDSRADQQRGIESDERRKTNGNASPIAAATFADAALVRDERDDQRCLAVFIFRASSIANSTRPTDAVFRSKSSHLHIPEDDRERHRTQATPRPRPSRP